jgi:hypothetical protein
MRIHQTVLSKSRSERLDSAIRRTALLMLWMAALLSTANAGQFETNFEYFCPKGNGMLIGNNMYLSGQVARFIPDRRSKDPSEFRLSPPLDWTFVDCSDESYVCVDATEEASKARRRLFVPRNPVVGQSYSLGDAVAFVSAAATSDSSTMQVEISQPRDGGTIATKLTIRDGRGAIFLDGINFWEPNAYQLGETCALQSKKGLFSGVRVKVPRPSEVY